MKPITMKLSWRRGNEDFIDNRYSRQHTWQFDGGAVIPASSSPDIVPLPMSDAVAVDPEEAFVASLSSCHMLWFLSIAAKRGFVVDGYSDDPFGLMGKNGGGKLVVKDVTLRPVIQWAGPPQPSSSEVAEMHRLAHEECFIANSVRTNVHMEIPE